jgi:hypothetical protein
MIELIGDEDVAGAIDRDVDRNVQRRLNRRAAVSGVVLGAIQRWSEWCLTFARTGKRRKGEDL